MSRFTDDHYWIVNQLVDAANAGGITLNISQLARDLGIPRSTLRKYIWRIDEDRYDCASSGSKKLPTQWAVKFVNARTNHSIKDNKQPDITMRTEYTIKSDDEAIVSSTSSTITSIDELLDFFNIDRAVWEPERPTVNTWQGFHKVGDEEEPRIVTMYQIKTSLRRKVSKQLEDATTLLIERFSNSTAPPKYNMPDVALDSSERNHLLEVCLYDHHFGKLAWPSETGEAYDLPIADMLYRKALERILARSETYHIDRILMPIGHDLLNYDNARGETANGTPQDNDSRPALVFDTACSAVIYAVEKLAEVAPVDVVYVPGNHDTNTGRYVTSVVKAWFRNTLHVTVNASPAPRKAYTYGNVFIGLAHGDGPAKYLNHLPTVFASEFPKEWGSTKYHEIHIGHFHSRSEVSYMPLSNTGGVFVRVLPSLCGRDYWHAKMGFIGSTRATDAYVWSGETGLSGYLSIGVDELL